MTEISKSERKRQMHLVQELGLKLSDMQPSIWRQLDLSENLQQALHEYALLGSKEAKRRQMQYIGKLMRNHDAQSITSWIEQQALRQRSSSMRASRLPERFNDLMQNRQSALVSLFNDYPEVDRQQIMRLLRHVPEGSSHSYPPKVTHTQKLWKMLASLDSGEQD